MVESNKIKVLNILSGAKFGGAELFFERLAVSFEKNKNIDQQVLIKSNKERFDRLDKKVKNLSQINFFNYYNPFCSLKIEEIIREFKPEIILSWMNRASKLLPKKRINSEIKLKIIQNVTLL